MDKQETLEEAAKEFFRKFKHTHSPDSYYLALVDFAKLQAEKMYSEEDMKLSFEAGLRKANSVKKHSECWKEWFEQFKKK